ncbi:MAG: hydantoinase/oxoprolinase family protein [Gaiellaceae bacterium]
MSDATLHVGVDVGGTFTDLVCAGKDGASWVTKVPTTPEDPSVGVMNGLVELSRLRDEPSASFLAKIDVIVHGTTVATNAILTGRGARTGLITTRGVRDALEMRRGVRERLYDNKYKPPPPLVPRYLRLGVGGRLDVAGSELEPLAEDELVSAVETLRENDVESIAICFMHAYVDGEHESLANDVVLREFPEVYSCLSHELLPERKFYERVSTTCINAFVGPILRNYLGALEESLRAEGFAGVVRVMKSNGGIMSPDVAVREAAHTILSGPAGAVAAGTFYSALEEEPDSIVMDMGGTSFDVCLIEGGTPLVTRDGSVARYRLMLPILDIHTVGAGGGSIAAVDAGGLLEVGPASAGSTPGPACYERGGELPTVTDADVVLGYIDPDYFLGGRMTLRRDLATQAIETHVATSLGLPVVEAAAGIYDVINAKMSAAIREVSVQRGYDPRRFTVVVAGGASAVHACAIADDIGIDRLLVPRDPGVFSAFGMLQTDFRHDFVRTYYRPLVEADAAAMRQAFDDMSEQGVEILGSEGVSGDGVAHQLRMDLRYEGQVHEVELNIAASDLDEPGFAGIHQKFHAAHESIYAYATEDDPVEVVNLRVASVGETWRADLSEQHHPSSAGEGAPKAQRSVYFGHLREFVETPIYDGASLVPGQRIAGPAIVEMPDTSLVVNDHFDLDCDRYANLRLTRKGA